MTNTVESKISTVRQRIRDHEAKIQQLRGRRQSLLEQQERYAAELSKAGLTAEQLPAKIAELNQEVARLVEELESVLDSVGA